MIRNKFAVSVWAVAVLLGGAAVQAEELVVKLPRHGKPQRRIGRGRDAGRNLLDEKIGRRYTIIADWDSVRAARGIRS